MIDMQLISVIVSAVIAYLLGSVNTAIIISALSGKDIRKEGSGNAGATNTLRVMGKKAAAMVALFDGLKGVLAILAARMVSVLFGADSNAPVCFSALAVMLGHVYPVYFGFKGGKGIMTTTAVMFMLDWRIGLTVFVICITVMLTTKYVSLGSCIGAVLFPVLIIIFHWGNFVLAAVSVAIGALALFKHRSNIQRLLNGTESKLNFKK